MTLKRLESAQQHGKLILINDNTRPHVAQSVKGTLKDFKWEVLLPPIILSRHRSIGLSPLPVDGTWAVLPESRRARKATKKVEDEELQALLDEDDAQTQEKLSDYLNINRQAVSLRLHAMGKIRNNASQIE
ncbi:CNOT6L [Cordylochernes scorpioides]|uniref:CNOT6L n=1 Tax=Cordylochernes scorpioides TaxID=51811 RepID=A0ABY6KDN9_9ARAC|nr:CNOT6L [Cordylochernes scorpioides]